MADILIRGISIPRNCFECHLFTNCDACEGHECGCGLLGGIGYEEDISEDRRRDNCPLVELPEHGDLIDISTVLEIVMPYIPDDDGSCSKANEDLRYMLDDIEAAPVIVQSNKEESK